MQIGHGEGTGKSGNHVYSSSQYLVVWSATAASGWARMPWNCPGP